MEKDTCIGAHVERCQKCINGNYIGAVNFGLGKMPCSTCGGTGVIVEWARAEDEVMQGLEKDE